MKKIIYLLPIIFVVLISCKSILINEKKNSIGLNKEINYIPYYLKVYDADSLFIVGNYERSYEVLDSLFKKYEPLDMDIYYEYSTYLKSKLMTNREVKLFEVKYLITKFGYTLDFINNDSVFKNSFCFMFLNHDNTYKKLRDKYLNSTNKILRLRISDMKSKDQLYRNEDYRKNLSLQNQIDSINSIELKNIFNSDGFPSKNVVGN